jgi:uncharacterized protein YqgV (UPF0045/DUF77 family)
MKLTADISLYPVTDEFIPIIKKFISTLSEYKELSILRNNVSTQISGEYDDVIRILHDEMKNVFELHRSVFVIKFLMGDKVNE